MQPVLLALGLALVALPLLARKGASEFNTDATIDTPPLAGGVDGTRSMSTNTVGTQTSPILDLGAAGVTQPDYSPFAAVHREDFSSVHGWPQDGDPGVSVPQFPGASSVAPDNPPAAAPVPAVMAPAPAPAPYSSDPLNERVSIPRSPSRALSL